jgi:hypothetical protein
MGDGDCFSIGGNHWLHAIRWHLPSTHEPSQRSHGHDERFLRRPNRHLAARSS